MRHRFSVPPLQKIPIRARHPFSEEIGTLGTPGLWKISAQYASLSQTMANRAWQTALLSCFAFSSITIILANGSIPKQDRSWKRYYNPQWKYCVAYPARWRKGDAFEGSGIFIETGVKRFSNPLGEMDIAALPDQTNAPPTLIDTMRVHLEGLKKFERAQQIELLAQRPMDLAGKSGLFAKERYYDPLERTKWVDELVFAERQNVLYRLELECRADQLSRFEPVFAHFVSTFQFDCTEDSKLILKPYAGASSRDDGVLSK